MTAGLDRPLSLGMPFTRWLRCHRLHLLALLLTATLLGCMGCAQLPKMVPDLSRRAAPQLQVAGAQGPLSAAKAKAVIDRLQQGGQVSDTFMRHLALEEELAGTPLTAGNQVTLLQDGPATYRAMFAAIEGARDHVHMETYILEDDEVGQRFAALLIAKRQQGVAVHLIRDSAGTLGTPAQFFQKLTDAGVQVLEFNPINPLAALSEQKDWELNQRDHRKLLIVDGRVAFLGGINISSVYSGGSFSQQARPKANGNLAWRDTDLQLKGPVVADLQKLFLASWAAQKGPALPSRQYYPPPVQAGPHLVRAIGSSPDEPFSRIYATLLSAIASAETSIRITNAYFVPDPQLLQALQSAARRGVDVVLILPAQTDSWIVFHAGRASYESLLAAGVKIYQRRGVVLHSKTALIDGVWSTVGSTNLDWRSFLHNHELNAVVLGASFGSQVQAMFDRDLAESEAITLTNWRQRPLDLRAKEWLAALWEYWL